MGVIWSRQAEAGPVSAREPYSWWCYNAMQHGHVDKNGARAGTFVVYCTYCGWIPRVLRVPDVRGSVLMVKIARWRGT